MLRGCSDLIRLSACKCGVRFPTPSALQNILEIIRKDPVVELVGYKMVDGNEFGLVVKLKNGEINWFFEKELSEIL